MLRPAATAECRFGNPVCMKQISPDTVFDAVDTHLQSHRRQQVVPPQRSIPVPALDETKQSERHTAW